MDESRADPLLVIPPFVGRLYSGVGYSVEEVGHSNGELGQNEVPGSTFDMGNGLVVHAMASGEVIFNFMRYKDAPIAQVLLRDETARGVETSTQQSLAFRRRIHLMNGYLICLRSALLLRGITIIGLKDYIVAVDDVEWFWKVCCSRPVQARAYTTSLDDHQAAFNLLKKIYAFDNGRLLEVLNSVALAYYLAENGSPGESIAISWMACELIIERTWRDHLTSTCGDDTARRKRLNDTRTYTSSVKLEILQLRNLLQAGDAKRMHAARAARNSYLHLGKSPRSETAFDSAEVAGRLLSQVIGHPIRFSTGPGAFNTSSHIGEPSEHIAPEALEYLGISIV